VLATASLLLALASGCFLDEIDKSNANASHMGDAKAPAQGAAAPAQPAADASGKRPDAEKRTAAIGPAWWKTARTLGSDKSDSTIGRCDLPKGSGFMSRDDCLLRGGQPH
jgi:hypothetical protein